MADLNLALSPAKSVSTATADLCLSPGLTWTPAIIPLHLLGYDVEPYHVVAGYPMAESDGGAVVVLDVGLNGHATLPTFPAPLEVDTGADARWLPTTDSYTSAGWTDVGGGAQLLPPDAGSPQLLLGASYWRAGGYVDSPMVSIDDGEWLQVDSPGWSATQLCMIVVAVLRPPTGDWYGVIESGDSGPDTVLDAATTPYLGLRYTGDGVLALHASTRLGAIRLDGGHAGAPRPVIVGLAADLGAGTVRMIALDRTARLVGARLLSAHPLDAALYVGRCPSGQDTTASMEILEIDYWSAAADDHELLTRAANLDRIYGVTTT